jgi:hypothetical protein
MTADVRLNGAKLKAKWAWLHITHAQRTISEFMGANPKPYKISTKVDPQTRELRYYLARVESPPEVLSLIIGDALFNLRSALDHLAQQFYLLGSGTTTPSARTQFPICESAKEYADQSPNRLKGMRQDAVDFIDATKPYKGGNDELWRLNKLNNIDKHRLLITVGGSFGTLTMPTEMRAQLQKSFPGIGFFDRPIVGRMVNNMCPLKTGDVLVTSPPDSKPDSEMKFGLGVALHEPAVLESQPAIVVLCKLAQTVNDILDRSRPLLT